MRLHFTRELVDLLGTTNYFELSKSPACIAILPFVYPNYTGFEIGVFMGTSSRIFLEHCQFMYFIDPCCTYQDSSDPTWFTKADDFRKVVAPYGSDHFEFIVDYSEHAAPKVPPVDFGFIDGNHKKAYVAKDIELYWPKIKPGGFLSGHDYNQDGVRAAVHEFAEANHLPVEKHQYCWLIRKKL